MFKFTIPGECVGKGRPKFSTIHGFAQSITPAKTVNYENWVKACFLEKYPTAKAFDKDVPLVMTIYCYKKIPKSVSVKKREAMLSGIIRPTTKPDNSNIVKGIEDALNSIAYYDDSQLVDTYQRKFYSENPRVVVLIKEI